MKGFILWSKLDFTGFYLKFELFVQFVKVFKKFFFVITDLVGPLSVLINSKTFQFFVLKILKPSKLYLKTVENSF